MYKTVRHGENSLQYTILPQTEEVLNNSGVKGKGRDYSPSIHVRRSRRKSTVKYVLLVLFGIIVALALASVPLYVMNGALYARRNHQGGHEVNTNAPLTPTGREIVKSRKKELKVAPEAVTTAEPVVDTSTTTASTTTVVTTPGVVIVTASEKVTTTRNALPAMKTWWRSTASPTVRPVPTEDDGKIPLIGTPSGSIRLLDRYNSEKPWRVVNPSANPEPITLFNVVRHYLPPDKTATSDPEVFDLMTMEAKHSADQSHVTTEDAMTERSKMRDLKDAILSVDDDDEFKDSLEVDEVFSLPPLKPVGDADEVTVSKPGGWYGARWPFVDTSSYFQWTGYSPGDNLLLPLLVAALSSVALVLLLTLAVKRRKRSHGHTAQIGKLTADLQADDNTNLLTAENPDDAEE